MALLVKTQQYQQVDFWNWMSMNEPVSYVCASELKLMLQGSICGALFIMRNNFPAFVTVAFFGCLSGSEFGLVPRQCMSCVLAFKNL